MPFAVRIQTSDRIPPSYQGELATLDSYPKGMMSWTNIQQAKEIIPFGRFVQIDETATDAKNVQIWAGVKPLIGVAFCPLDFVTHETTLPGAAQYSIGDEVCITDSIDVWCQVKASVTALTRFTAVRVDIVDATYKGCVTDAVVAANAVVEVPGCLIDSPVIDLGSNVKIVRVMFRNRLV